MSALPNLCLETYILELIFHAVHKNTVLTTERKLAFLSYSFVVIGRAHEINTSGPAQIRRQFVGQMS